jgi:hypothetical protein
MGTQKRPELSSTTKVPGPGSYPIRTSVGEGPKIGLSARIKGLKAVISVPGPGAYEPKHDITHNRMPSTGLGYGNRGIPLNKHSKFVPGPGTYAQPGNPNDGPRFKFGTSQRTSYEVSKNPGPGNYT